MPVLGAWERVVFRRQTAGEAPVVRRIHFVVWAWSVQTTEPANSTGIRPVQPDQLNACGNHPVGMAVQCRMYQDITGGGVYATDVARFLEAAGQDYGRIGAQMPVSGQAEAAG
jgi:hypothetical protein